MFILEQVLEDLGSLYDEASSYDEWLQLADEYLELEGITEVQYDKIVKHIKFEILDVERFVKVNDCKVVSNPRAFFKDAIPSDDGLLSNRIFGITAEERANIFAYIDLHGWFMDPCCYKTWIRLDKNIRNCIHGIGYYSIDDKGLVVEDPKGSNGIDFLRKNIQRIKFKPSDSVKKNLSIDFLNKNRDRMFIQKYIVIPPFYRDKNTSDSRSVGLGGINKFYTNLIVASNAIETTQDYMFDASEPMRGRVQECILNIYDWFAGNANPNIESELGGGMSGKLGIMRRTNMSKTSNFSSRLVISAAELKAETVNDMMVNFDHTALPLAATIAEFRDFIIFHVRRFFDLEFQGKETYPIIDINGQVKYIVPETPEVYFSDDRIREEMMRYLEGYNNRFVPVVIPVEGTKEVYYMRFIGTGVDPSVIQKDENGEFINVSNPESIVNRRMTWLDIFYQAAVKATANRKILITRFPIDSFSNQIATGVVVSSTKKTEPIYYNGEYYPYYPYIRDNMIGTDTSNTFVDTLRMSNLYLSGMGAD